MLPRFVVTAGIVSLSYILGALAAWYETVVLIGHLDPPRYLLGTAFTVVYLWFAVAVVALAASVTRTVVGTAGASIGILLVLPVVALIPGVKEWLPSTLAGAQDAMAGTAPARNFLRAVAVSAVATASTLIVALARFRHREV